MNADMAQVVAEARFHECTRSMIKRLTRRLKHLMDQQRGSSVPRGGRTSLHPAPVLTAGSAHSAAVRVFATGTLTLQQAGPNGLIYACGRGRN
jgi:hypothetical protein